VIIVGRNLLKSPIKRRNLYPSALGAVLTTTNINKIFFVCFKKYTYLCGINLKL